MEMYGDFQASVKRALGEIDPDYQLRKGLVICGTHTPKEVDILIDKIREARENKIPFLGICHGHQLSAVEYARNVMGVKDAVSEEWGKGTLVVRKRDNLNVGHRGDGSYWNNYEVAIEWEKPDWFVTTQSHPEYESCKGHKHPLLIKFLKLCGNVK
jgi:CTP synthase (UTP-ammonia lyase)